MEPAETPLRRECAQVTVTNVSDISADLFILGVIFILLIFSLLSLGILRMFQQRFRAGWISFGGAVISAVVFFLILDRWYV
ncbi:hypothetical protein Theco_2008 [Thermobacillus composti KWC4]|jgi:hypothetical protein|uniref:Uncharacterized protein n=1 Tax=Thermobacillus composti (strain DSM 18247 / JCM 13945 / KWC4) TaxID=717605 RepID=L0EG49_THECK|nr:MULTISPECIES: hypothetical protein [Thermobacillus]AGA58130.1 hypothetical protein Theco_2008 [Thermobacillus composti KWC4]